jgi:glycosyltransferase involved in cell wall biosynthesis
LSPTADARPRRVLLAPYEVAGYFTNLRKGFQEVGLEATAVALSGHAFSYDDAAPPNALVAALGWLGQRRGTAASRWRRGFWRLLQFPLLPALLVWELAAFDAFVFSYGTSPLFPVDAAILRRLGRPMVFVFHGCDARPPYMDGLTTSLMRNPSGQRLARVTRRKKRRLLRIERYATAIVAQPLLGQLFERPFVSFLAIGLPYADRPAPGESSGNGPIRVLHSPSQPHIKGTATIREAVRKVQARGHDVEYVELTGVPNSRVLQEIGRADLVIDQAYSDTPMGGFPAEAAFAGRPSIVGGYLEEELRRLVPPELQPPVRLCRPEELAEALEGLVTDETLRRLLGQEAHEFVMSRWRQRDVAGRYLRLFAADIPAEWLCDPQAVRYVHGNGLPEARVRELVTAVVSFGGPAALQVGDKPELERALLDLAQEAA